jgi:hypothetical protein
MQNIRQKENLQRQGKKRRNIQMVLAGDVSDYSRVQGKEKPLPCKQIDQSVDPPLDEHAKRSQEYERRQETVNMCRSNQVHISPV